MKRLISTCYSLLALSLIFFATACATQTSSPTLITAAINFTRSAPTNTPPPTEIPLSSAGPWLLFTTNYHLYALNQDGTGLKPLVPDLSIREIEISPSTNVVAAITVEDGELTHAITLMELPSGNIIRKIPLLSYYADNPKSLDDGPAGPFGGLHNIEWSPDGRYLAFMGAIESPSSSLYVYDTKSQTIKRLSENQYQAANPNWSPDGKYVVFEEISSFHGWITEGIWAASIESNASRLLYKPARPFDQEISGWLGDEKFVVMDRDNGYGEGNVRVVNVTTRDIKNLYSGYFTPFTTDGKGTFVFLPINHESPGLESGFYMISPDISNPKILIKLESGRSYHPVMPWDPSTKSFVSEFPCGNEFERVTAFDLSGSSICIEKPVSNLSPNGAWYWVKNEKLSLYKIDGEKIGELTENYEIIFWNPNSSGAFAATDNEIYYISLPDMNSQNVYKYEQEYSYFDFIWAGLNH